MFWKSKNIDGQRVQAIYDVNVRFLKNSQHYDEFSGKTWLLATYLNYKLPNCSTCLVFPDSYDVRLGKFMKRRRVLQIRTPKVQNQTNLSSK